MSTPGKLPPVSADEALARFVIVGSWVRADKTLRQDAFIPPKDLNLSVTRHLHMSPAQLWQIGQAVVNARGHTLLGRADLAVFSVTKTALRVEPAPTDGNPQHAHITGWPLDKPAQKNIAQQLATVATFVPHPAGSQ